MANEVKHYYLPGQDITGKATAAITGKRFVRVDADAADWVPEGLKATATPNVAPVEPCPAGAKSLGVAQRDVANGGLVTVIREGVVPVTSGAAIAPGQEVESDATGRAIPLASGRACGYAMSRASAAAQTVAIALYS